MAFWRSLSQLRQGACHALTAAEQLMPQPLRLAPLAPLGPTHFQAPLAAGPAGPAAEVLGSWCDYLRPREFNVRLDVRMKRAAAPYPRNPNRKKPVPKVKGIIRKLIK